MKALLCLTAIFLSMIVSASSLNDAMNETEKSGYRLYQQAGGYGCHTCHGLAGTGFRFAGNDIRKATYQDYQRSLRENEAMQALQGALTQAQAESIFTAMAFLSRYPLVRIIVPSDDKAGQYETRLEEKTEPGSKVLLHVVNDSFSLKTIDLSEWQAGQAELAPLASAVLIGFAPSLSSNSHLTINN